MSNQLRISSSGQGGFLSSPMTPSGKALALVGAGALISLAGCSAAIAAGEAYVSAIVFTKLFAGTVFAVLTPLHFWITAGVLLLLASIICLKVAMARSPFARETEPLNPPVEQRVVPQVTESLIERQSQRPKLPSLTPEQKAAADKRKAARQAAGIMGDTRSHYQVQADRIANDKVDEALNGAAEDVIGPAPLQPYASAGAVVRHGSRFYRTTGFDFD